MVVRSDTLEHVTFSELPKLLRPDDLLVLNETRVVAARLRGTRPSGGVAEFLLLHPSDSLRYDPTALRWIALARPARRLGVGTRVSFGTRGELGAAIVRAALPDGHREIELELAVPLERFLERAGTLPLPPYIQHPSPRVSRRYQTVFARVPGSVAAPTASLHFTRRLLGDLERRGVELTRITLNVGIGTFRPLAVERLEAHAMHAEAYEIPPEAAAAIARAKTAGRRVVAVGTTVVRALEGNIRRHGRIVPISEETDLFITPGYPFRVVDALITNFHLPRSSLLVLVSAFAGRSTIAAAYCEAVVRGYRFYSFGDAMLLERKAQRC